MLLEVQNAFRWTATCAETQSVSEALAPLALISSLLLSVDGFSTSLASYGYSYIVVIEPITHSADATMKKTKNGHREEHLLCTMDAH